MIRRPRAQRDHTDAYLRRIARVLGYKGRDLPLSIADVLEHPARPGEYALLHDEKRETRRQAADRLREWAYEKQGKD